MAKSKTGVPDKVAAEYMDIFEWAWKEARKYLQVMDELQRAYDTEVNTSAWPTRSKVPVNLHFNAVNKALPDAYDRLFPINVSLSPTDGEITTDQLDVNEWYLNRILGSEMRLQQYGTLTLNDAFKFGVGFGVVESVLVTPPRVVDMRVVTNSEEGEVEVGTRIKELGNPTRAMRYRYASPAQILGTPDGSEFNGPHRVSTGFFLDVYGEVQFRRMYSNKATDGEDVPLKGNVDEIIDQARSLGFDARMAVEDMVAKLGGEKLTPYDKANKNMPVKIPVLKCYSEDRHAWIANGTTTIYEAKDEEQTLYSPIVKASPWPDGTRFYPSSPASTSRRMVRAYNYFVGSLLDVLADYWNPPRVYDSVKFPSGLPQTGDIGAMGSARDAVQYLERQTVSQDVLAVGDLLKRQYGEAINQPEFLNQATPGLMRGGGNAFGDLTRNVSVRSALVSSILEMGWLEDIVQQTIMQSQANLDKPKTFRRRARKDKKNVIEKLTITPEDFLHTFEFEIDVGGGEAKTPSGAQNQITFAQSMKDDPYVDQRELRMTWAEATYGPKQARKLFPLSKEEGETIQAEQNAAILQERARRLATPGGEATERPEAQGLIGAGAQAVAGGGA